MTGSGPWTVLVVFAAIYLLGLGMLVGIVTERFRFDAVRSRVVRHFERATQRVRAQSMAREHEIRDAAGPAATPVTEHVRRSAAWAGYVEMVDAALAKRDTATAERAWREAHAAALQTRTWRPLLEVGDAALRIAATGGHRFVYVSRAREAYLAALLRARAQQSLDGVLHVAEAFHALGDQRVVEQCVKIAEGFGSSGDEETLVRLRALTQRAFDAGATPRPMP